jgi:hypothetical protein
MNAELYDPNGGGAGVGTFTATAALSTGRGSYAAVLLPNGKVLVVGGMIDNSPFNTATAELFDPNGGGAGVGTFANTGSMSVARSHLSATLLPTGKVLIIGGLSGTAMSESELYDPDTGTFSVTGSLNMQRYATPSVLLPNGFVFVPGGNNGGFLSGAELYQ